MPLFILCFIFHALSKASLLRESSLRARLESIMKGLKGSDAMTSYPSRYKQTTKLQDVFEVSMESNIKVL